VKTKIRGGSSTLKLPSRTTRVVPLRLGRGLARRARNFAKDFKLLINNTILLAQSTAWRIHGTDEHLTSLPHPLATLVRTSRHARTTAVDTSRAPKPLRCKEQICAPSTEVQRSQHRTHSTLLVRVPHDWMKSEQSLVITLNLIFVSAPASRRLCITRAHGRSPFSRASEMASEQTYTTVQLEERQCDVYIQIIES